MTSPRSETALEYLQRTGVFYVTLIGDGFEGRKPEEPVPTHETVLRPLLGMARGAWVYGIKPGSQASASAGEILVRDKGRHRIRTEGEPIVGREYFWNATAGKRGSIVVLVDCNAPAFLRLLPFCHSPRIMSNYTVAHTPSAIRFAREQVASGEQIACLLSRSNGFRWMHIMARPDIAEPLFAQAKRLCDPS
jgi:hypothetical protein